MKVPEPSAEEGCPVGVDLAGVLGFRFLTSFTVGGLVNVGLVLEEVCSWRRGGGVVKYGPTILPENGGISFKLLWSN